MKILQINNVYAEKSTGHLTRLLHRELLAEGHESLVVFGRGQGVKEPGVYRLCPEWYGKMNGLFVRLTGMPYGGCLLSTRRLICLIRREMPDVVHLQCVNGHFVNIYRLLRWLKEQRINTVVSLHAEFLYTGSCAHAYGCSQWQKGCKNCPDGRKATESWLFDRTEEAWKRMAEAFRGFGEHCVICPVSPWTASRAGMGEILKGIPMVTVKNAVDTAVFYPGGEKEENAVLHVTAHFSGEKDHPKGGWYILELARRLPQVTFYVAGRAERVEELPGNVKLLGVIREQEKLAEYYRRAGVTVITSRAETFSMPCAESLCCGTPVAGFAAGGPESIALKEYADFIPFGDVDKLERAVVARLAEKGDPGPIGREAGEAYSQRRMLREFEKVYRSLV